VATLGLSKEEIRRIALTKLRVVYREWGIERPFARAESGLRTRRDDPRAFVVALVAALLGGLSEAIERNTRALAAELRGARRAPPAKTARQRTARRRRG
jgi:hypothetical protein